MIEGAVAIAQTALAAPAALAGLILAGGDPLSHVLPHALSSDPNSFWHHVTNHMLMLVVSAVLLMVFVPLAARKTALVPTGFRNFVEAILQYIREEVARPVLGKDTDTFITFLWTIFALILTANLLGMIPITEMSQLATQNWHLHLGGTATGNIGITAGFAICAFLLFHLSGIRKLGAGHYAKHALLGHGPLWLAPLFIPIEIIGALVKPFALAIRLFANMTGGHIVLAVILGFAVTGIQMAITEGAYGMLGVTLVSVLGAVAINLLEIFVAFLQAYIFTFLTALFLGAAIHPEH
ncbi:MAG: F0F1 ATP synthase subunit A [Planctomycetota bacterium]|nr:F0F1 ATP synthase subunit A [Planctomycetota bacterium]